MMNNRILIILLFIGISALFGCSKTHDEYLNNAKKYMKEKNYNKALINYEKACNKGSFKGCYDLGNIYSKGKIVEKNLEKAEIFYKNAAEYSEKYCKTNSNSEACIMAAKLYEAGSGVTKDLNIADSFYTKACDLNNAAACFYLARINADNIKSFISYADKACQNNMAYACLQLGNTYLTGFNESMAVIQKDIEKGISYIKKACEINNEICANLADIYISGDDVAQNYETAAAFYETALKYYEKLCDEKNNDSPACRSIAVIKSKYSFDNKTIY